MGYQINHGLIQPIQSRPIDIGGSFMDALTESQDRTRRQEQDNLRTKLMLEDRGIAAEDRQRQRQMQDARFKWEIADRGRAEAERAAKIQAGRFYAGGDVPGAQRALASQGDISGAIALDGAQHQKIQRGMEFLGKTGEFLARAGSEQEFNEIVGTVKRMGIDVSEYEDAAQPWEARRNKARVMTNFAAKQLEEQLRIAEMQGKLRKAQAPEDIKDHQSKDALFAERIQRTNGIIADVTDPASRKTGNYVDPTRPSNSWWPDTGRIAEMTNSRGWQQYQQAAREGIAAFLRKDTGAAVTQGEWDLYFPMLYPQPGDSPEVVRNKAVARQQMAQGLQSASGPAYRQMFPAGPVVPQGRVPPRGALTPAAPALSPPTPAPVGAEPQQPQAAAQPRPGPSVQRAEVLAEAQQLIQAKPHLRGQIIQRMQQLGIDPSSLGQ